MVVLQRRASLASASAQLEADLSTGALGGLLRQQGKVRRALGAPADKEAAASTGNHLCCNFYGLSVLF